jgi:acyl-coenzyme A synthetase/AMP-(fatty) acid ligase
MAQLLNLYGCAEVSADATAYEWRPWVEGTTVDNHVPAGRPIANTMVTVLDSNQWPVAPYVVGDVYVSGAVMAIGYANDNSGVGFVKVGNGEQAKPAFRTGDIGYYDTDFQLRLLGREDDQVKINGQRFDTHEIDRVLQQIQGVNDSITVWVEAPVNALNSFVVIDFILAEEQLRTALNEQLPRFMHPKRLIMLPHLPRLSNGKVDRIRLRMVALETLQQTSTDTVSEPKFNENEALIAELWKRLLRINHIQRYDTFFSLGGDSLQAMEFLLEIELNGHIDIAPQLIMGRSLESLATKFVRHPAAISDNSLNLV